jgi:hypothetical protein
MEEKMTESMKIEKNVNLDLKEGICTERNFCLIFYAVKIIFLCTLSYF